MAGQGPGEGTRKRCCEKAASATTAGQEHNGNASTEKSVPLDKGLSVIIQQNKSCSWLVVLTLGHDPVLELLPALSVWIGGTKEVGT